MKYYLMVDLGTGSTRVALTDSDGNILALSSFFNSYHKDDSYSDAQYFLPREWEKEIMRCCDEIHARCPDVKVSAVSAAGARQSIVLLDRDGNAFYGLPNIDNRGRDYMDELDDKDEIYRLSGKWVTEDFCAAKLFGLKKLYPEMYGRIASVLSLSGWICAMFTGAKVFEPSQACETQLYDIRAKAWSSALCDKYGIDISVLPELLSAGSTAGHIYPELIERFGMDSDARFIVGGADTQAALRQTGIKPGDLAVVSGTTSPVVTLSETPYYDSRQRVWVDANLAAEGYIVEMNPGVTGLNYQRIKAALCPDLSYEQLEAEYAEKTDFGCTASFSSLLFYEQRSLRHGGFYMNSPMSADIDRSDMAWAVLADIACSIYEQLFRLMDLTDTKPNYILCCGGGFRSKELCGMLSELSGLELRLRPGFEQATINGLVSLCNEALGETARADMQDYISCFPRGRELIKRYHKLWSANRLSANLL